jgi:hypothetical protein
LAFDKLSHAFQKDMVDLIFRLQDQVKPIRVYLAVETKSGPLNGLATQIEETAKLPNPDDILSGGTKSVSSNADPMSSYARKPLSLSYQVLPLSSVLNCASCIPTSVWHDQCEYRIHNEKQRGTGMLEAIRLGRNDRTSLADCSQNHAR